MATRRNARVVNRALTGRQSDELVDALGAAGVAPSNRRAHRAAKNFSSNQVSLHLGDGSSMHYLL